VLELVSRQGSEPRETRRRAPARPAPVPPAVARVLALQRCVGNAQVARLLQRQEQEREPEEAEEEQSPGRAQEVFDELRRPVALGESTHTLSIRMVDGVPEPGVETKWTRLAVIDEQIRGRVQVRGTPYTEAWRVLDREHDKLVSAVQRLRKAETAYESAMRKWKANRRQGDEPPSGKVDFEVRAVQLQTTRYNEAASSFLRVAYDAFGEQVALILGELVPTHEKDPLAGANYGGRRYHTGTQTDPIPIVWYKPVANYLPMSLDDYDGAGNLLGAQARVLN
jgi:hypothetical protein